MHSWDVFLFFLYMKPFIMEMEQAIFPLLYLNMWRNDTLNAAIIHYIPPSSTFLSPVSSSCYNVDVHFLVHFYLSNFCVRRPSSYFLSAGWISASTAYVTSSISAPLYLWLSLPSVLILSLRLTSCQASPPPLPPSVWLYFLFRTLYFSLCTTLCPSVFIGRLPGVFFFSVTLNTALSRSQTPDLSSLCENLHNWLGVLHGQTIAHTHCIYVFAPGPLLLQRPPS